MYTLVFLFSLAVLLLILYLSNSLLYAVHFFFFFFFFFQAEDGIRDLYVTGVQTCALPISTRATRNATTRITATKTSMHKSTGSHGRWTRKGARSLCGRSSASWSRISPAR